MKAVIPLLVGLLHLVGCSVGKPAGNEIAEIEAITAKDACVGQLNRWHRNFSFYQRGLRIDRNLIAVGYTEAGHRGLLAGRSISEPAQSNFIDDSQHRVAWGVYDRKNRRFVEWMCGCSFPPYSVDHRIECPANGS